MEDKFKIIEALQKFSIVLLEVEHVKAEDNELIISYRFTGKRNFLEVVFPENYKVVYYHQVYLTDIVNRTEWKRMYVLNDRNGLIKEYTNH